MFTQSSTPVQQFEQIIRKDDLDHVLVMRPDTISDVVMLSPALRTLREALPDSEITLLTSEAGSQVALLVPWVDKVLIYPEAWKNITETTLLNLRKDMDFIERLRNQRFSAAIIFTSINQSPWPAAYACYLAGIPYRVGFAKDFNGSALSHCSSPPADDLHQIDRNLNLLGAIGIYETNNSMELNISQEVERTARELLIENGVKPDVPYIVIAPEARYPEDRYNPDHFAAVTRLLAAQTELQLLIVGSSERAETIQPVLQLAEENLYGNIYSLVGRITTPELAAIIRRASLTITNRSASMYLADAFQSPTIILYPGIEDISSWKPRSPFARLLCRPATCSICNGDHCPYGMKCLDIRPEEVAIVALEMLSKQTYPQIAYHILQEYQSKGFDI